MKIKITRTTVAADGFVKAGQVLDLPEAEARMLIGIKKAILWEADEPAATKELSTDTAGALIDAEPKKRGRKR